MKKIFIVYGVLLSFLIVPKISFAAGKSWKFLPSRTLFSPLIADPREPQTGFVLLTDKGQAEGTIGRSFDLFQWKLSRKDRFGWGLTGAAFALLDYGGGSFPMRANDWEFGSYFSHSRRKFSQRLEFTHVSAHLGDALSSERARIVYSREFIRWIFSYKPNSFFRLYGGGGFLVHTFPDVKPFFSQGGTELFSPAVDFISHPLRFYTAYDVKFKEEAGGVINHSIQFGIKWRPFRKGTRKSIRLGVSYFKGNHEFGQFLSEKESHWGFGIYFDS